MSSSHLDQMDLAADADWAERCLSEIAALAVAVIGPERRSKIRHPAFGAALIKPDFGAPIPCALVDRSEEGARLQVLSVLGVPDQFVLSVGAEQLRARVIWRSPSEIGVALHPE